jgi:superfamily II DNA or RNA helicase
VRSPGVTYVDNYAWLPKDRVNVALVRGALMYGDAPSEGVVEEHHIRVPRHFPRDLPEPVERVQRVWDAVPIPVKTPMRDYQLEPFMSMCRAGGGVLNLGCGYGKTFVALNYIASRGLKAIVIVDKVGLLEQWKCEIANHLDIDLNLVGWVQGSKWQWKEHRIVLASLSTLSRRARDEKLPEGFCESFGVAVYDECHHLSASVFAQTCPLFYGERHGLTATPRREDGLEQVFLNHLGPIHYSRVDQELMPTCVFLTTEVDAQEELDADASRRGKDRVILDKSGELNHRKLCAWLGRSTPRNALIVELASRLVQRGHHVLCVTHSVEHARHMHSLVPNSGLASGDVNPDERRSAIANARVSFATVDVAAEALNVPTLSALVVMTPFGARTQGNLLQQALGRIQRKVEGKKDPLAFFIEDAPIPMCRGLLRQVKRKLTEWGYPQETFYVGETSTGGVVEVRELQRVRLAPDEKETRIRVRQPRG